MPTALYITSFPADRKVAIIKAVHKLSGIRPVPTFSEQNQLVAILIGFWGSRNTRKRYIQRGFLE